MSTSGPARCIGGLAAEVPGNEGMHDESVHGAAIASIFVGDASIPDIGIVIQSHVPPGWRAMLGAPRALHRR
jgi:hypothetical protein